MKKEVKPFCGRFTECAIDYSGLVKIVKGVTTFIIIRIDKSDKNSPQNFYCQGRNEIFSPGMLIGISTVADLKCNCIDYRQEERQQHIVQYG